jgi:hypothetical protein
MTSPLPNISSLGYIIKAKIAYFNSKPSIPLVNGLKQSGTDHMLAFFEDMKEISYHTLWYVPLNSGGTALVSTLRTSGSKAVEIDHRNDPDMSVGIWHP